MSTSFKTIVLAAALALPLQALAEEAPAPAPAPAAAAAADTDNLYVGVGLFADMINANIEVVTGWGNFMLRAGRFHNTGEGVAANMSWRRAIHTDDARGSGYYMGLFGGQVSADPFEDGVVQRLGAGGELGYHWVSDYTRLEATVGLGAAEEKKDAVSGRVILPAEPTVFFSFTAALGY